jgi:hypothetical protein
MADRLMEDVMRAVVSLQKQPPAKPTHRSHHRSAQHTC